MNQNKTFGQIFKSALIAGLLAALVNSIWNFSLIKLLTIENLPKGFAMAIVFSSVLPMFIGALFYYIMQKFFTKANIIFYVIGITFIVLSTFPSFESVMPDGTPTPQHFIILTIPMHLFSGALGLYLIPKK